MAVRTLPKSELDKIIPLQECATLLFYKRGDTPELPSSSLTTLDHQQITHWMSGVTRTPIVFRNSFSYPISLYWEDEAVDPVPQGKLLPNEILSLDTILGHVFYASRITEDGSHDIIDFMMVNGKDGQLY